MTRGRWGTLSKPHHKSLPPPPASEKRRIGGSLKTVDNSCKRLLWTLPSVETASSASFGGLYSWRPHQNLLGVTTTSFSRCGRSCRTRNPQALAIFWYLDNRNESWKTSGIKDEDIEEIQSCPDCVTEVQEEETRYI